MRRCISARRQRPLSPNFEPRTRRRGLAKRYGPSRLKAACALALGLGAGYYRQVRDILANGADLVEPAPAEREWVAPEHDSLRGAIYFH